MRNNLFILFFSLLLSFSFLISNTQILAVTPELNETQKLLASDGFVNDQFGIDVSIDGQVAIVGSFGGGAAYIYRFDGITWLEEEKITNVMPLKVAISGDVAIIQSLLPNTFFQTFDIYRYDGATWIKEQTINSTGIFGDLDLDNDLFVLGRLSVPFFGGIPSVIFTRYDETTETWVHEQAFGGAQNNIYFANGVSLHGDVAVARSFEQEVRVYRYDRDLEVWTIEQTISQPSEKNFGRRTAIYDDVILVGARDSQSIRSVYIYRYDDDDKQWYQEQRLIQPVSSQYAESLALNQNIALIGAPGDAGGTGAAYLYRYEQGVWLEAFKLLASDGVAIDNFGESVSLTDEYALVGTQMFSKPGAAYLFNLAAKITAEIDIKPGEEPNSINLGSEGNVPVAIFGNEDLDVSTIDIATLKLAMGNIKTVGKQSKYLCSMEDINDDGHDDLICHFLTSELNLQLGDTTATLEGLTVDGIGIEGEDAVNIVHE